ncbi:Uncharacterised protein [Mycobacteroides abscessus subsp. abscessus]|nr:Uncharacterised protein [Mycobacteroides abscessus subsp. abscessus]
MAASGAGASAADSSVGWPARVRRRVRVRLGFSPSARSPRGSRRFGPPENFSPIEPVTSAAMFSSVNKCGEVE